MILSLVNQKGGVGKTTTAYEIAKAVTARGIRPLLIDLDSSGNLTERCGGLLNGSLTVCDILGGASKPTHSVRQARQYMTLGNGSGYIVPSSKHLENIAAGLMLRNFGRLTALRKAIYREPVEPLIIIDTQPHIGVLTLNALVASTHVIICVEPEDDAIAGASAIMEEIAKIADEGDEPPAVMGILATKVDAVASRHADNLARLMGPNMPPLLGQIPKRIGRDADKHLALAYAPIADQVLAEAGLLPADVVLHADRLAVPDA